MSKFLIALTLFVSVSAYSQDTELDSLLSLVKSYKTRDSLRVQYLLGATSYHNSREPAKSLELIEEALVLSIEIEYKLGEGNALNALSSNYLLNSELDSALSFALQAKEVLESIHDQNGLINVNRNLARVYSRINRHEESIRMLLENVRLVADNPPSSSKAGHYFYLAKNYHQISQLDSAEKLYLVAIDISREANFLTGVSIGEGSLGTLYSQIGENQKALYYLNKTLQFSIKYNQKSNIGATYIAIANCYEALGNTNKAIEYSDKAIEIYEELQNFSTLLDAYKKQYERYEKLSNFKLSNHYLKEHYRVVDSIFSNDRVSIIEELTTKYETEKKEAEIVELTAQATIQKLELRQKEQWIVFGLLGFILIGTLAFFFLRTSAIQKQRSRTELEQRFLRSQLNPHFISNALLAVQQFMLKNDTAQAGVYLAKFSKLMRQILENSRQEYISVEEEKQMLQDYLDIHKLRLDGAFKFEIVIEDSIDEEVDMIPPMFVQPFVENAIEHGIEDGTTDGLIKIHFKKEDDFIGIDILDNGKGLYSNSDEIENHRSLSTTIIKERINLFNQSLKKKIELVLAEIKSGEGKVTGTKVYLKVPFS